MTQTNGHCWEWWTRRKGLERTGKSCRIPLTTVNQAEWWEIPIEFPAKQVYSPASSKDTFLNWNTSISLSVVLRPAVWKRMRKADPRPKTWGKREGSGTTLGLGNFGESLHLSGWFKNQLDARKTTWKHSITFRGIKYCCPAPSPSIYLHPHQASHMETLSSKTQSIAMELSPLVGSTGNFHGIGKTKAWEKPKAKTSTEIASDCPVIKLPCMSCLRTVNQADWLASPI